MGAVPVARFLAELNRERSDHSAEPAPPIPTARENNAHAVEDAYAQGFKDGKAKAWVEFDTETTAQRRQFEQELAAARAAWAEQEGAALAAKIEAGLDTIEKSVSTVVARILQPYLMDAVRRRAVEELIETLKLLLAKDEGVTLHISGPEDLLQMVRDGLYGKTVAVVYSPSEQCDIHVAAGKTFMETRLGAWIAKLKEAAEP